MRSSLSDSGSLVQIEDLSSQDQREASGEQQSADQATKADLAEQAMNPVPQIQSKQHHRNRDQEGSDGIGIERVHDEISGAACDAEHKQHCQYRGTKLVLGQSLGIEIDRKKYARHGAKERADSAR